METLEKRRVHRALDARSGDKRRIIVACGRVRRAFDQTLIVASLSFDELLIVQADLAPRPNGRSSLSREASTVAMEKSSPTGPIAFQSETTKLLPFLFGQPHKRRFEPVEDALVNNVIRRIIGFPATDMHG